jgi:putative PIN family toxin of toxin-antitoxin system
MNVVLDTNILVSSLLKPGGNPTKLIELMSEEKIVPYYDRRIWAEYYDVLWRPNLKLPTPENAMLLEIVEWFGIHVVALPCDKAMIDESDRPFYETAKTANAYLVTGNVKHFPDEPFIVSPSKFLELFEARK